MPVFSKNSLRPEIRKQQKLDPKAKSRNRDNIAFSAESKSVTDNKDHFLVDNLKQARSALARLGQFLKSGRTPKWYKGSLSAFSNAVCRKVKGNYPLIDVKVGLKKMLGDSFILPWDTVGVAKKDQYDFKMDISKISEEEITLEIEELAKLFDPDHVPANSAISSVNFDIELRKSFSVKKKDGTELLIAKQTDIFDNPDIFSGMHEHGAPLLSEEEGAHLHVFFDVHAPSIVARFIITEEDGAHNHYNTKSQFAEPEYQNSGYHSHTIIDGIGDSVTTVAVDTDYDDNPRITSREYMSGHRHEVLTAALSWAGQHRHQIMLGDGRILISLLPIDLVRLKFILDKLPEESIQKINKLQDPYLDSILELRDILNETETDLNKFIEVSKEKLNLDTTIALLKNELNRIKNDEIKLNKKEGDNLEILLRKEYKLVSNVRETFDSIEGYETLITKLDSTEEILEEILKYMTEHRGEEALRPFVKDRIGISDLTLEELEQVDLHKVDQLDVTDLADDMLAVMSKDQLVLTCKLLHKTSSKLISVNKRFSEGMADQEEIETFKSSDEFQLVEKLLNNLKEENEYTGEDLNYFSLIEDGVGEGLTDIDKSTKPFYTYGIVLKPYAKSKGDLQGHTYVGSEVVKACDFYLKKGRNAGFMHAQLINNKAVVVQSFTAPVTFSLKVGGKSHKIEKDTWIAKFEILDSGLKTLIKNKKIKSYSIGGIAFASKLK